MPSVGGHKPGFCEDRIENSKHNGVYDKNL